jgi:hypothetical protein
VFSDLVCLERGFGKRVGEDELGLERGGDGDEGLVAVLSDGRAVNNSNSSQWYKETGKTHIRQNSVGD